MSKKIMLINPPYAEPDYMSTYSMFPLGIGYVGAYLKTLKHHVEFLDLSVMKIKGEEIGDMIKAFDPDYVGIGGVTTHYLHAMEIFEYIKTIDNSIITVYGGVHATAMPEYIMSKNSDLDFIIVGEGELIFPELIKSNERCKDDYSEVDGLVWRKNGEVIINQPRDYVCDLDSLPYPWSIINPLDYQKGIPHSGIYKKIPVAPILTTRGCPFRCTYCAARVVHGSKIRVRSAKNIADEIEFLVDNFGIKEIKIVDDNFTFNYDHAKSVAEEILNRNLDIVWACSNGVRADRVDYDLLKLMKKSGCYYLAFGFEFGSDRILKLCKKSLNKDKAIQTVKTAKDLGYFTNGFFLMAHPEEKAEDLEMTRSMVKEIPLDRIGLGMVIPLPGTELFDYYLEHNLINLDHMDWSFANFEVKNKYLTKKELYWWYITIVKSFYLRPSKIWNVIISIRNLQQVKLYYRILKNLLRNFLAIQF